MPTKPILYSFIHSKLTPLFLFSSNFLLHCPVSILAYNLVYSSDKHNKFGINSTFLSLTMQVYLCRYLLLLCLLLRTWLSSYRRAIPKWWIPARTPLWRTSSIIPLFYVEVTPILKELPWFHMSLLPLPHFSTYLWSKCLSSSSSTLSNSYRNPLQSG